MEPHPRCPGAASARPATEVAAPIGATARALSCVWALALMLVLSPAQGGLLGGGVELRSQEELSDAAGEFTASRYLVYRGTDEKFHHFQETGKFGPLGPTGKFRIDKRLMALPDLLPGAVITYDQNQGVFRLRDDRGRQAVKADFVERYTREEERYLKAMAAARRFESAGPSPEKGEAGMALLRAAIESRRLDDAERLGRELLAMAYEVHTMHTYLGRIALERKDLEGAARHLVASAEETPATGPLVSFGPSMALAKPMAEAGQWDAVARYLRACQRFWDKPQLRDWQRYIEERRVPDFGANRFYGR